MKYVWIVEVSRELDFVHETAELHLFSSKNKCKKKFDELIDKFINETDDIREIDRKETIIHITCDNGWFSCNYRKQYVL